MYHLRLKKGLSYAGAVHATKAKPDVFTDDAVKYSLAMKSGYFEDLTAYEDNDIKIYEPRSSAISESSPNAVEDVEDSEPEEAQEDPLDAMSVTELRAYATVKGIELGKKKRREDILAAIKESEKRADEARRALVES